MIKKREMVDEKVTKVVNAVLKERMERFGFQRATVLVGQDHDGDPVLLIDADYAYSSDPIDVRATVGLVSALRDALEDIGEFRFPHVRHHFDERQRTAKSA
ncbi:MAG: hypothetical protein WAN43_09665 [Rhodomicrobium sp.]|jgi:hypothetical protein